MSITQPVEVPAVTIGTREVRLQSFKAFKAAHALSILAEVGDAAKEITEQYHAFIRDYGTEHKVRVTEALSVVQGWNVPDAQFQVDEGGTRYIEIPSRPSDEAAFLEVFEQGWKLARTHVVRVLALLLVDNGRLADAEDQGPDQVADLLDAEGKKLLREAEMWEIVDLAHAARLLMVREMETRAGKVGKLRNLLSTTRSSAPPSAAEPSTTSPTSETPTGTSTGSPTSAATPTDGPDEKPSTDLATATSSTS